MNDLTRTLAPLRELQKSLEPLRAFQEALKKQTLRERAVISAFQEARKKQVAVLRPLTTELDAFRPLRVELPAVRPKPALAPTPNRPHRPAIANDPEVEASQRAFRARMLERWPDFF